MSLGRTLPGRCDAGHVMVASSARTRRDLKGGGNNNTIANLFTAPKDLAVPL